MMTLNQAIHWLSEGVLIGNAETKVMRVNTDTRTLREGDLFVAIRGDQFDGNDYLEQAKSLGANAALAHRGLANIGMAGIEVKDTKKALGEIAAGWRSQFNLPVVAVTGSNGKTTVTQMLASIFKNFKDENALATVGNLNNDIGVPLTLLRLNKQHEIAVVELGMNHPGEIAYLANIAKPSIALVNNAQREHLEFMSTVLAVAHENGAVISALPNDGIAVFPADDEYTEVWRELALRRRTLTFSIQGQADVTCSEAVWCNGCWHVTAETTMGQIGYSLFIAGRHNIKNSLAAIACSLAAGVPLINIVQGLQSFKPVSGRSNAYAVNFEDTKITLVDDTYNANPDSVKAAIDVLAELDGPRLLVLGDMGEVGQDGLRFHAEVGAYAMARNIEKIFTLGALATQASKGIAGGQHFETSEAISAAVLRELNQSLVKSVLVKGSRFMKMENIVKAILSHQGTQKEQINAA